MYIDKLIRKQVISISITIIILLLIFMGVSFAYFFTVDSGNNTVINVGDLAITFCDDVDCNSTYTNYGQIIGTKRVDGVTTIAQIYPVTSSVALSSTPYIFNVQNTGSLELLLDIKIVEDEDFVPEGIYSSFTRLTNLYSNYLKLAINPCNDGIINNTNPTILDYDTLSDGTILTDYFIDSNQGQTFCLWAWVDNSAPNEVLDTYFAADLTFTAEYKPNLVS